MRLFLHAMPYEKAENIFKLVSVMKNVLIWIELRSLNDTKFVADSVMIQRINHIKDCYTH